MKITKKLVILGSGSIGMEALWVAEDMNRAATCDVTWDILGFGDDNPNRKGEKVQGYDVLGTSEELVDKLDKDVWFHCAIGNNASRALVAEFIKSRGFSCATLIHPSGVFEKSAKVGEGSYIGAGSIVAPMASIGDFVLINTLAGIGHHSVIGDYAQICPGAKINGNCKVGRLAFIGTNASLQPGNTVGECATVCANSFAVRSVKPHYVVSGIPARIFIPPKQKQFQDAS